MGFKITSLFFTFLILMVVALPPIQACGPCSQPPPKHHHKHPPHHGGSSGGGHGGSVHNPPKTHPTPPVVYPPIISPPVINPPVTIPPPSPYPPYVGNPPGPPSTPVTCPIDALKLGLCVDVLGGLVHIGLGDPVENACCPVLGGLLEIEAAVCLCASIRLKLLNINIFIPLALQALLTCGKTPPPGFICPPL